jgi:acyl-CoA thioesterase II
MHDLEEATRVAGADGQYRADLSEHWTIWSPNGGYLSSIALRAAAAESRFSRPASYQCQFLSVPKFGPIAIQVRSLKSARSAEAFGVSLVQEDRPILESLVWFADDAIEGLEHDVAPLPDVPPPADLKNHEELFGSPGSKLFENVERRPVDLIPPEVAAEPLHRIWLRFRPRETYDDRLLDTMRAMVACDTMYWPAVGNAYDHRKLNFIAPGLDLSVRFHHPMPASPWLYCETHADVATAGLLASTTRLWCESGRLLASSAAQAVCRPMRR